jgi:hypothetical protein
MTKHIFSIALIASAITFDSCKKSSDPTPSASACQVASITIATGGSSIGANLSYDGSGKITKEAVTIGGSALTSKTFTYGNDGLVATADGGTISGYTHHEVWTYTNKLVTKVASTDTDPSTSPATVKTYEMTYTYSGQKLTGYSGTFSDGSTESGVFTYTGDNVTSAQITQFDDFIGIPIVSTNTYGGYDTKNNFNVLAASAVGGQVFIPGSDAPTIDYVSKNNYTTFNVGNNPGTVTYTYNSSGYPVTSTLNDSIGSNQATTIVYANCQ